MTIAQRYTETTNRLQADPVATHSDEAAAAVFSARSSIMDPSCQDATEGLEWVPDREAALVPAEMRSLCAACPSRQNCLLTALEADAWGYWAGTTTKDRQMMVSIGQTSVETADWLQERVRTAHDQDQRGRAPKHPNGAGGLKSYRKLRCRCDVCREANRVARAAERAKASQRVDA